MRIFKRTVTVGVCLLGAVFLFSVVMCRSAYRRGPPRESRVDGAEFRAHIGFRVVLVTEPTE